MKPTHRNERDEVRSGISEVGVVTEHVAGEEGRDGGTEGSCIVHHDQYTHVCPDTKKEPRLRKTQFKERTEIWKEELLSMCVREVAPWLGE